MYPYVLLIIAKIWKHPKCPSAGEWVKNCGTFTKWNTMQQESPPSATAWMELENIVLSKISQLVKDKYHMIPALRGI